MHPDEPGPASTLSRLARALVRDEDAQYRLLFAICACFTVAPLWAGTVLPFQDYAGNMSYAAILSGARQAGSLYDTTYETGGLLLPNGLLFWSWTWLSDVLGLIIAGKVLLSLYAVGLPLAVDRLLVASGRHRAFALLAFPLVYNSSMMMGFASFVSAVPVALYALARAYRFRDDPTIRNGAVVAFLSMATFIGHAQMYLLLGVMAMGFVALGARSVREGVRLAAPFAVSLLLFVPWFWVEFVQPMDTTSLGGRDLTPRYEHPSQLLGNWGTYTLGRWAGRFDDWTMVAMAGVFGIGLAARRVEAMPGEGRGRYVLEGITLLVLITYLAVPEHTVVQAAIGSRHVALVVLLAITWLHMPSVRWMRAGLLASMAAMAIVFGANAAATVAQFDANEIGEDFLPLLDGLPDGSRLAFITQERHSDAVTVLAHQHIYGYHFALNGGLAFSGFHSFQGRHATWRPGQRISYPGRDPRGFLRGKASCWFEYLLIRTTHIPRWQHMEPRVTYVGHSAQYTLWRIDRTRIPACRRKPPPPPSEEVPETASPVVSKAAPAPASPPPPSSILAPSVGHARGRDMRGDFGPAESGRPRKAARPTKPKKRPPRTVPVRPGTSALGPMGLRTRLSSPIGSPSPPAATSVPMGPALAIPDTRTPTPRPPGSP